MGIRFRPSPTDGETTQRENVDFELIQVTSFIVQWYTLRGVSVFFKVALLHDGFNNGHGNSTIRRYLIKNNPYVDSIETC